MKKQLTVFTRGLLLAACLLLGGMLWGQETRAQLENEAETVQRLTATGQFDKAMALIPSLRLQAKAAKHWSLYCTTFLMESAYTAYTGDYERELGLIKEALKASETYLGKKHIRYGEALLYIARYYDDVEGRTDIDSLFEEAMAIAKDTLGKECMIYALALNSYGMYKQKIGETATAENMLWESLDILKRVDTIKEDYAAALNNMAIYLAQGGRYKEAENFFLQAIAIHEGISGKDYANKALDLQNLGTFYSYVKEYKKSEQYYLAAITLDSTNFGIGHPNCKLTRGNLLAVYAQTDRFKELVPIAEDLLGDEMPQSELELVQEQIYPWLMAGYVGLGQLDDAEATGRKYLALQINRYGHRHNKTARAYCELLRVYGRKMEKDSIYRYAELAMRANAVQDFDKADLEREGYALFGRLDYQNRVTAWRTFYSLQLALQRIYEREPSATNRERLLAVSKAALSHQERLRLRLTNEGNQLSALAGKQVFIGALLSVLMAGQNLEEQSRAFELVEQNKATVLAAALQNNKQHSRPNIPDSLLTQENKLKTHISTLQAEWLEAPSEQEKQKITSALSQANLDLEALQQHIRSLDTAYYNQLYAPKTLSLKAAQAILPADALLLEFFISETDIFLFAATPTAFKAYKTPIKEHEFKTQIDSLRFLVSDMRFLVEDPQACINAYSQLGHEVYTLLLQQALADFPDARQLIIVPDQQLWNIPFEALLTEAPSGKIAFKDLPYLLHKYQVSYAYSATLLAENQTAASRQEAAPQKALLLAADYSMPPPSNENGKKQALRRMLAPLPAARREVENIAQILQVSQLDAQTHGEAAFKSQAADYNIIHLAMHGIIDEKYPELSSLAFSEVGDTAQDNFLQAHEIAKLRLRARLVVLSACETGVGRLAQGEGAMSLGRAFMYAGVPSLVISLWPVNDGATASLMHSFYLKIDQNLPPAQALRTAKIDYLDRSQGIASHPAFWAAFVHLGHNHPANPTPNSNWMWWALCTSLALLALAAAWRFTRKS